ncbi:hypothetical protein BDF22DRAFT_664755 [Syncephalis plumigaleata]|nr:hypothetical protein BDF22DRAFT_664755 [Syncephalis plumigaleata]
MVIEQKGFPYFIMQNIIRIFDVEVGFLIPGIFVYGLVFAIQARNCLHSVYLLYDFYETRLITKSFYLSKEQAYHLRRQLVGHGFTLPYTPRYRSGVLYHGSKPRVPKWNTRFPMAMFSRRNKHRKFPYIFLITLMHAVTGLAEAILSIIYIVYLPTSCITRAVLTGIFFELNSLGLDVVLATKAYVLNQKYLYQSASTPDPIIRGWMTMWISISVKNTTRWIGIIGACLLLVKHGFAITMFTMYNGLAYVAARGCAATYFPRFFLVLVGLDGAVVIFLGLIFVVALRAHIHRIKENVQEAGVLAIYHGLLQSDILQLIVSTVGAVTVALVYTLVTLPGNFVLFYPLVLAHAITGFFAIESLKSGVRTRRHVRRKGLQAQLVTLYV